ncbi:MaoC family dehydratase [Paraglaciecola arctica]|uniref:MaoC domain-containing protein n=1 Tax=Paraglaciecola arctica BSs20135 TaxID=493475 RepID=K6YLS2_9ALTE|nr:MaoC family dehydratase [Paraglaciecola arctica]GAC17588.1 MaoC domain-containing protein [Paraglaciecola arctica BSs20135]
MFFEDYQPGQTSQFGVYQVTEEEIIEFATKFDPQFFHLDNEAAKHSLFGGICASGWHTASMFMRMLIDNLPEKHGSLGSPGINNIKWLKPVYPGYILSVNSRVSHCRLTKSKPGVGLICVNYEIVNQDDLIVMTLESNAFIRCRDG